MTASRALARLWSGQAASSLGDAVFTVSAVLWVDRDLAAGRPWAAAAVAGVTAAAYAAIAVAGPAAGVIVDRFDRRTVMAATELARAGLATALAAACFAPAGVMPAGAWLAALYATVFALNAAGQLFVPARLAVIAAIVPGDVGRAHAVGVAEAAAQVARAAGPLVAAPLMLVGGIRAALLVNAVSYLASWASVRCLPESRPARDGDSGGAGLRAGIRAFAASRSLTRLLSVTLLCQLGSGAVTGLTVLVVTGDLHGTAGTYGLAEALIGAGLAAGSAAAGYLVRAVGPRAVTCGGLLAAAALTAGYALARDVPAGLALLAAYAAAMGLLNASVTPVLMGAVPDGYRGRVLALWGPANQAAGAASVLASGWLASSVLRGLHPAGLGPVSLLLLIGAALIAAAGIRAAAVLPPRRREDPVAATTGPEPAACPDCGAPATDHGGITQCTADPAHIDVYDLGAIKGPVTLKYKKPRSLEPRPRPDGLTEGERMAIGWARERHARWGDKGRGVADSMRQQWPWLDDAELARIALYFGTVIEHAHKLRWPDLDVISWTRVLKAAALELASLELDGPE